MPEKRTTRKYKTGQTSLRGTSYQRSRIAAAQKSRNRTTKKQGKLRRSTQRNLMLAAAVFLFLLVSIGIFQFATRKNGMEIKVAEITVGIVKDKNITGEDLANTVSAQLKEERGAAIQIKEAITVTPVHITKKDVPVTLDTVITEIKNKITYKVEAAVILADGAPIAILNNTQEANNLLTEIQNEYIPEESKENMTAEFSQEVKVESQYVASEEIITIEEAREKFTAGTTAQKPYTIKTGDTLSKIAANNDMTIEEVLAANPGMTIQTNLVIGKQINITVTTPFLSVKTIETVTYTEREPKNVVEQADSTKPAGYRKVIQQGKDGQSTVTSQIIRINGFEEERKEISREYIEAPVDEIILKGTK